MGHLYVASWLVHSFAGPFVALQLRATDAYLVWDSGASRVRERRKCLGQLPLIYWYHCFGGVKTEIVKKEPWASK